jgi:DNA-binding MurR/RpiR family transcriptional regulator
MAKPPEERGPDGPMPTSALPATANSGPATSGPANTGAAVSIAEKIRQRLGELSPSERRVARTLLTGPPTIGLESSVRLARFAGVSGPTVSRFIAELGFSSYAAFQRALHEEIAARMMTPVEVYRRHQEAERSADVLGASARMLGEAVAASVSGLDSEEYRRAVSLIADGGRQVLVTGGWFSQLLAGYLASVLRELRPGVRLVGPSASDRAGAIADIGKRDTVVAFDFRRYERDTLEIARATQAAGGRILLVTDPWLSPVADIADAVLTAQVTGPAPFESLTPALAVVETLITSVVDALGEAGRDRFERFGEMVERWVHPWPDGAGKVDRETAREVAADPPLHV